MQKYFQIFQLLGTEHHEPDGYYIKTITSYKLQEVDWYTDQYDTLEEAELQLNNKAEHGVKYTIQPIYREPQSWE